MRLLQRNLFAQLLAASALGAPMFAQTATPTVGGGAPNLTVTNAFLQAYFRNGFDLAVAAAPDNNVSKYGPAGYYQQFSLASNSMVKLGLVVPSLSAAGVDGAVLQVLNPLYSYYSSVGVNTAGYPTLDTQPCPGVAGCQYQIFSLNYALFYYASGNPNGNGFSVSGSIFTVWNSLGGPASALGMAVDAQAAVTSPSKTTALSQQFAGGLAIAVTSGIDSGSAFAVAEPVYDLYLSLGGPAGVIGLPTSNDVVLADGSHRQTFEGGRIVYTAGNPATILFPVNEIDISPAALTLQFGQTVTVTVSLYDNEGSPALGRSVSWATSNSSAVSIAPAGYSAVLKGVGAGTALITATSEGIVGKPLAVTAIEPCCQIGQGAPTAAIQSAFQAAVARNRLDVLVPAPSAVRRAATGYVQDLSSPDGTVPYLVAKSDLNGLAFVVPGAILTSYNLNGGPAGALAYPSSDLSGGGTQLFEGGALAGNPVQVVTGPVLKKWASSNYEAGPLGLPAGAQSAFKSQSGYAGFSQVFVGGTIFGTSNGALGGQAFQSAGLILVRYLALSGPAGEMGISVADPFTITGVVRQNFENGYIDLQPGAPAAIEHLAPRTPAVSATPATALPGSRLRLSIAGFNNNAALRVSQTGQPDFLVTVPNGSYQWDIYVPPGAAAGAVTIRASDTGGSATATGSYSIQSIAAAKLQLIKAQGDNQTGPPGSVLAVPLAIAITDGSGVPLPGVAVSFSASPGASVAPATAVTDLSGRAVTSLRLPAAPGIAAVTAQALGQLAIFDARTSGSAALANFPQFAAASPAGAEVAALASVIRFYQNLSSMPAANGLAAPAALDRFLLTLPDGYLNASQLVNLWRLVKFTGANLDVSAESPDLSTIAALVAGGDPVVLSLALTQDGSAAGGITLVGDGVGADGSLTVLDPNPAFNRVNLNDYLNGFSANGHAFAGSLLSAFRLLPRIPSATGFVLETISQPANAMPVLTAASAAGSCSLPLLFQDSYPSGALSSRFVYCDGTQPLYQLAVGPSTQAGLIDLSAGATAHDLSGPIAASYQVSRLSGQLTIAPPSVAFTASSILNAASFLPGLSPGGLFSLFGSGLSGPGADTTVSIGGLPATVLLSTPFQINAQVPAALPAGNSSIAVTSPFGNSSQAVAFQPASPGIFTIGMAADGVSTLGAVVNRNGALNGAAAPAVRGDFLTIYCTGLGAAGPSTEEVSAVLSGAEFPVSFAGLTPGFIGLYQVNFQIPLAAAPGLFLPLSLKEAGVLSNTIAVAVQ